MKSVCCLLEAEREQEEESCSFGFLLSLGSCFPFLGHSLLSLGISLLFLQVFRLLVCSFRVSVV